LNLPAEPAVLSIVMERRCRPLYGKNSKYKMSCLW